MAAAFACDPVLEVIRAVVVSSKTAAVSVALAPIEFIIVAVGALSCDSATAFLHYPLYNLILLGELWIRVVSSHLVFI